VAKETVRDEGVSSEIEDGVEEAQLAASTGYETSTAPKVGIEISMVG
jgi:hypothetical protein